MCERRGKAKKQSQKISKRKHPTWQRVRGKFSARVPGFPPAPAGRSPGEPPAPARRRLPGRVPLSVHRPVRLPTPPSAVPGLRGAAVGAWWRRLCRAPADRVASAALWLRRLQNPARRCRTGPDPAPLPTLRAPGPPPPRPLVEFFPAAVTLNQPECGLFLFRNQPPDCLWRTLRLRARLPLKLSRA